MKKYTKTAHLSFLERTNGGFIYILPSIIIKACAIVKYNDGTQQVVDYKNTNKLLEKLSKMDGLADVSFTQTSLEEGLANLYSKWKSQD